MNGVIDANQSKMGATDSATGAFPALIRAFVFPKRGHPGPFWHYLSLTSIGTSGHKRQRNKNGLATKSESAQDRYRLNGPAIKNDRLGSVTCVSQSIVADGWHKRRCDCSCVIDIRTKEIIMKGLSMAFSEFLFQRATPDRCQRSDRCREPLADRRTSGLC